MSSRVLLLTFFYPPDLSAGSFRAKALIDAFKRRVGEDAHIDVVTTQPNRYSTHLVSASDIEESAGVTVRRVDTHSTVSGFVGQMLSFWRYARFVSRQTAGCEYDLVVATSSRLMTAVLGAWVAYRCSARLYLDIRDIFVENLKLLFPAPAAGVLGWGFGLLERWAIRRANKVNLVSLGFSGYFKPRYPGRCFSFFPNGVDDAFVTFACAESAPSRHISEPLRVLYAGNVGDGQGLHLIIPTLAERMRGRMVFSVVGDGGRLELLRKEIEHRALDNVELLPPVARDELVALYRRCDLLFLHLNDFSAFRRVLPSKLFEYAATGKPIWAGVGGFAAEFVSKEIANTALFAPCDIDGALKSFERLDLGQVDRSVFVERYRRSRIMDDMAEDILSLLETRS